jgi:hypothetical protein
VLAAGLFICWLDRAGGLARPPGSGPTGLADRTFAVGKPVTLKDCRVERIVHDLEAGSGSMRPWALIVSYRHLSIFCVFGEKWALGAVRVGDMIDMHSATGPSEAASVPMVLLRDCRLIAWVSDEHQAREPGAAPDPGGIPVFCD